MKTLSWFCAATLAVVLAVPSVRAQEGPKPGPEHEVLKKMEGNWDLTMRFGGMESKGTAEYKMGVGGLWLTSALEIDLFGSKFYGHGMDTFDPATKKYVSYLFETWAAGRASWRGPTTRTKRR